VAWGLTVAVGVQGAMDGIWLPAATGDLAEVERLVAQDPGLLDAKTTSSGWTALIFASQAGHVGVVRWLLDHGAAINDQAKYGETALWHACFKGRTPVVKLLLERGADPIIAATDRSTGLMVASACGHLEVVDLLLGDPGAKATLNNRDDQGKTALWFACYEGRGGIVTVLLESGADPTIAHDNGTTPMAIAKQDPPSNPHGITAEGRRECVAALEVRLSVLFVTQSSPSLRYAALK
jgi:ankyrin repeat protein